MSLEDPASERIVLAGIFKYGRDAYIDVAELLTPNTFVDKANQALYKCYKYLFEKKEFENLDKSDIYSASSELDYKWLFEKPDELAHLVGIFNTSVELENIRKWAGKIRKLEIARSLQEKLKEIQQDIKGITGDETIDEIISSVEKPLYDFSALNSNLISSPQLIGRGAREHLLEIYEKRKKQKDNVLIGISSGYPCYDSHIGGGYRRKTVSLIGARTGVGKSMIAANIALNVGRNLNIPILYIDTEMSAEDHWYRMIANLSQVEINDLESGGFYKDVGAKQRIRGALKTIEGLPIHYVNVSGKNFDEHISIMRRWIQREVGYDQEGNLNHCLIIYDYVKLLSGIGISHNVAEYQLLGFMMTSLHNFVVQYDLPILAFIQLNREGIDKENTGVIAGSDRVVWLSTNFSIFKEKTPEEIVTISDGSTHKLIVLKSRHGRGSSPTDYINMKMIGKFGKILEINTKHNQILNQVKDVENVTEAFSIE